MNTILIFIWIILAFVSTSFWEAYIEGKHPWASRQIGWSRKISNHITLTAYHFWLLITFIFLLTLPVVVTGWNAKLFGIILSAACIGIIVEDFLWFVINPYYSLKKFNSNDAPWYPWVNLGAIELPALYLVSFAISILSWYFLWK